MYKVLTHNNIAKIGLDRFPDNGYSISNEMAEPDAILLRSFKLHGLEIPKTLKCVGRAGAGVNNIPVAEYSKLGIPVFNTPGANANAVKELVIVGMLLAARNICPAWDFTRSLEGEDDVISSLVEKGKKKFAGSELAGKTLAIVGLGAIGVNVANAALALGMKVIGFDPALTLENAWRMSASVTKASSIEEMLSAADFITLHVPLNDKTRNMIDATRIGLLKNHAVLLNFSREGIVDADAVCNALDAGKIKAYVCDFPEKRLINQSGAILLPHLGASTEEAEENCAMMVVDQVRDFLENGNIKNSVNFPEVIMPRSEGYRLGITNENVPNMVGQITSALAEAKLNILDLLNKSRGEYAYTLIDLSDAVPQETLAKIAEIKGVLSVRSI